MKKIISFFILLIFFGAVFFIGWTQIKVKPDSYAIVISKTSGVDPNPVIPGEFSWHWQFLIPTNAELKIFSINPVNAKKTISGSVTNPNSIQNIDYSFDFAISLTVLSVCSVSMTVMAIISLIENTVLIFLEKSKNNQIKNILWDIFTLIFGIIILIFSIFVKQLSLGI